MNDTKKPPALKLAKLPDRKPVKMTITLSAELATMLQAYAAAYHKAYGDAEDPGTLVPFMLAAFIDSDRAFKQLRQSLGPEGRARREEDGQEQSTETCALVAESGPIQGSAKSPR